MSSRLRQRASKSAGLVVPPMFRAVKHGGNVKGRPGGSVAQCAECSHGKRGPGCKSRSGHDFFLSCDMSIQIFMLSRVEDNFFITSGPDYSKFIL